MNTQTQAVLPLLLCPCSTGTGGLSDPQLQVRSTMTRCSRPEEGIWRPCQVNLDRVVVTLGFEFSQACIFVSSALS